VIERAIPSSASSMLQLSARGPRLDPGGVSGL